MTRLDEVTRRAASHHQCAATLSTAQTRVRARTHCCCNCCSWCCYYCGKRSYRIVPIRIDLSGPWALAFVSKMARVSISRSSGQVSKKNARQTFVDQVVTHERGSGSGSYGRQSSRPTCERIGSSIEIVSSPQDDESRPFLKVRNRGAKSPDTWPIPTTSVSPRLWRVTVLFSRSNNRRSSHQGRRK